MIYYKGEDYWKPLEGFEPAPNRWAFLTDDQWILQVLGTTNGPCGGSWGPYGGGRLLLGRLTQGILCPHRLFQEAAPLWGFIILSTTQALLIIDEEVHSQTHDV